MNVNIINTTVDLPVCTSIQTYKKQQPRLYMYKTSMHIPYMVGHTKKMMWHKTYTNIDL